MVLAVYMPPHDPEDGQALRSMPSKSSCDIRPAVNSPTASKAERRLENAGNLVHISARDAESGVVASNGFGVGRFEQAVNVTARVVEQFDLADAELVDFAVLRLLRDLLDGLIR